MRRTVFTVLAIGTWLPGWFSDCEPSSGQFRSRGARPASRRFPAQVGGQDPFGAYEVVKDWPPKHQHPARK